VLTTESKEGLNPSIPCNLSRTFDEERHAPAGMVEPSSFNERKHDTTNIVGATEL
jgi:hypothetical protein